MAKGLYTIIPSHLEQLLSDIQSGRLGLPDLQRPFVWKDNKVRELLDSMLKGFPIGFVMSWESPCDYVNTKQIGANNKNYPNARDVIIDGQQRLTALLAAIKGVEIIDSDYKKRNINISYHPFKREFAVWSQAYERSPEWISSISDLFKADANKTLPLLRMEYIKQNNEKRAKEGVEALGFEDAILLENSINDVLKLMDYDLPTLSISSKASEEDVADIFVRVNSGGQKLTEQDFIYTLLAVYDNDIHKHIYDFCKDSRIKADGTSYNNILEIENVHLIRSAVGVAFHRAKLRYAYMLLRGKDLDTGKYDNETQEINLYKFRDAIYKVTNLNNWHTFLNIIAEAGYLKDSLISAPNAVVFSYMFYLIAKEEYKVPPMSLRHLMKRFFFVATITSYFSWSTETRVERIFADLRNIDSSDGFIEYFNNLIAGQFTDDYFKVTILNDLTNSSTRSTLWSGYIAAMNVFNYPMLFSNTPLSYFFIVGTSGTKSAIDIHHIFPKNHLAKLGITEDRDRNQIANLAYLDFQTNINISDSSPAEYVAEFKKQLGEDMYIQNCKQNALPIGFENMDYDTFLNERRKLMAEMIKAAYEKLSL